MPVVPRIAMGNNAVFGFPPQMLTKLRYCESYALVSTSGSIAKQVMYVNSTFDPDNTGGGHQPLYRDTYASLYDQYAVVAATIKVTFSTLATTTGVHVGVLIDDDSSTSSTFSTLCEQNLGKHALLAPATGALSNKTIVLKWNCKKHLGIDPFTSQTYKTSVGSNPLEIASFLLWASPADGSTTTTTQVYIELVQEVLWTELTTPTQS